MKVSDLIVGLGAVGVVMFVVVLVFIPLAGAWIIASVVCGWLGLAGWSWWIVTVFIWLLLLSLVNRLSGDK